MVKCFNGSDANGSRRPALKPFLSRHCAFDVLRMRKKASSGESENRDDLRPCGSGDFSLFGTPLHSSVRGCCGRIRKYSTKAARYALYLVRRLALSGRNGFPFWEYARDENNLEKLFPQDPIMPLVNTLLAKCVVREERDCLSTAEELLAEVNALVKQIDARRGPRPDGAETWPCRMCGKGTYRHATRASGMAAHLRGQPLILAQISGSSGTDNLPFGIFVCDHCGHAELFKAYT